MAGPAGGAIVPVATGAAKAGSNLLGWAGVGANVLGSAFSGISGNKSAKAAKETYRKAIRWRVADAQAAGIHPLYALGSAGANIPSFSTSGSAAGDGLATLGRGMERMASAKKRSALEEMALQNDRDRIASQGKVDEAQAAMYNSQAALNAQALNAQGGEAAALGAEEFVPSKIVSRDPKEKHRIAGQKSGFVEVLIDNGRGGVESIQVPRQELGDSEITAPIIWTKQLYNQYIRGGWGTRLGDWAERTLNRASQRRAKQALQRRKYLQGK